MTPRVIRVKVGDRWFTVEVEDTSSSPVRANVDGQSFLVEVEGQSAPAALPTPSPSSPLPAASTNVLPAPAQARAAPPSARPTPVSEKVIRAPMPARVMAIRVRPGESVTRGQELCVVEAMKMEQSIHAPADGVIKVVHVTPLQQVGANDPLVELE